VAAIWIVRQAMVTRRLRPGRCFPAGHAWWNERALAWKREAVPLPEPEKPNGEHGAMALTPVALLV